MDKPSIEEVYQGLKNVFHPGEYKLFRNQLSTFGAMMAIGDVDAAKRLFSASKKRVKPLYRVRRDILSLLEQLSPSQNRQDLLATISLLKNVLMYFSDTVAVDKDKNDSSEAFEEPNVVKEKEERELAGGSREAKSPNLSYRFFVEDNYRLDQTPNQPSYLAKEKLSLGGRQLKTFKLSVAYPGLVTGVGIAYENPAEEGVKTGFSLDYNTGYPVIQGSSVKGRLRSLCEQLASEEPSLTEEDMKLGIEQDSLQARIEAVTGETFSGNLQDFITAIFGNKEENQGTIWEQDLFFDAFVLDATCLQDDFVTKHTLYKDVVPARFLRIKPDTEIEFKCLVNDYLTEEDIITSDQKLELFAGILRDYGIGAKINKGYGQFK